MSTETMQFRTLSGHAKLSHSEHFPGVEREGEGEREKTGRIAVTASRPIGGTKNEARRLLGAGDELIVINRLIDDATQEAP